jgi:hypothetical protein
MDMDQFFVHTASDSSSLDMSYDWGVHVWSGQEQTH